ncbi:type II toxin-antitoxin system HipA family toxin [Persicimonas caeni]|uniref:Type II toxin-antitoxin system HipA family toxin n=1 Tax=Persicimonas caeni TaxID=2292766 RepID=A0A4Y6Q2S6_PERCE|nr:type II toxin-antitoxin system HipA family toxin [Persicimonas caeni]QED36078.1 type II toxin-antitoxin system HipA family toxin [Persicimonas caeni]
MTGGRGPRGAICSRLGVSVDNDVALLRALGDDTAGALRFVSQTHQPAREERQRQPIELEPLEEWASEAPAFLADSERPPRLLLAGAQHKASVVVTSSGLALSAWSEAITHILTFDSPRFAHLAANEYLTTCFAAELGLTVVRSRLDARTSPSSSTSSVTTERSTASRYGGFTRRTFARFSASCPRASTRPMEARRCLKSHRG